MKRFVFVVALFCLAATLCPAALARQAAQQAAQQAAPEPAAGAPSVAAAQSLLDAGKLDAALEMLTALATSATKDPRVDFLLGLAYYQKGDYTRAVAPLTTAAAAAAPGSPQYRVSIQLRGLSQYYLGHVREALPDLEQVASWSPQNLEIAYALGAGYIQALEADKARETFARLFSVPADSASAHLITAQMMVHQQAEGLAEKELQQALALDPKLPEANFLLGEMAIYRADIALGVELLQKEIALNPTNGMAYYRLGEAYARQLKWDDAVAPLQKSIWLNPYFSGPFIVLGKVYLKKSDLANAEDMLRRAVRMDPNNFAAHYLLAQVLQQANRLDEAKREFAEAQRLQTPSDGKN